MLMTMTVAGSFLDNQKLIKTSEQNYVKFIFLLLKSWNQIKYMKDD